MSTTPDTTKPAQQAFTDTQLQAAIDAAISQSKHAVLVARTYYDGWDETANIRLAIARAFLAELGKIMSAPTEGAPATSEPDADPYARLKAYNNAGARIRWVSDGVYLKHKDWKWTDHPDLYEVHPDDLHLVPEYAPKHPYDQKNWKQYAEKPAWSLPPPPAGHKWHRDDWTQDMLPEGYRPLLDGELIEKSDEVWQYAEGPWKNETIAVGLTVSRRNHHFRTCRPLPSWSQANAEPKKAEALLKTLNLWKQ